MRIEDEIIELKKRVAVLEEILNSSYQKPKQEDSLRDKTKYYFCGKVLTKNRLVLAVVKKYIDDKNPTKEELFKVFDKSLQGSLGVVRTLSEAQSNLDAKKRFFMNDSDLIKLRDGNICVVCSQWGIFNINRFIKLASLLGYRIEEV